MTRRSSLARLADDTFHSVILQFDAGVPETYHSCVRLLRDLERKVSQARLDRATKRSLLARVRTHLALLASETGDHHEADRLTANVLRFAASDDPNFALAVLLRTQTLHSLGRHEEEIADGLRYADFAALAGSTLVYLLAELARRHPDMMQWKEAVVMRVKEYFEESREIAELSRDVPSPEVNPRDYVLHVEDLMRKAGQKRTAQLLAEAEEEG